MSTETLQFQTETKRLLDLVINSIYTNKEIFIRELISNASDAIDKLHIEALTNHDLLGDEDPDYKIQIYIDPESKTIKISDNGIGMTREEVITNIGTIAKSGTKEFLEKISDNPNSVDENLIGQFGVGFYSAFMVSDKVELVTRKAGTDQQATRWISDGTGEYTIEDDEKSDRGTIITLYLKDKYCGDETNYTDVYEIERLVKQYSNYIRYPIIMTFNTKNDKDEDITEDRVVNSMQPLWTRNRNDITEEDYNEFFKQQFHEWKAPMETFLIKGEGTVEYTALLCIPSQADPNLYFVDFDAGLQLYARSVFVMDKCKDFLPDYLRFVKGLVDSPDLPLNISRETLQYNAEIKRIGRAIEKQVVKRLQRVLGENKEKYLAFWKEYGKSIKLGLYENVYNKKLQDELKGLLLFKSTKSNGEYISLQDYVNNSLDNQQQIYFAIGNSEEAIDNLPQMEFFRDNNLEVIYSTENTDEFAFDALKEFAGMEIRSITRDGIKPFKEEESDTDDTDSDSEDKKDTTDDKNIQDEKITKLNEQYKDLLKDIKDVLKEDVNEVKITDKLKSSAACISSGEHGPSLNVESLYKAVGNTFYRAVRILELNSDHDIFKKLEQVHKDFGKDSEEFSNICQILYNQVLLMNGMSPKDPIKLAKLMEKLIVSK